MRRAAYKKLPALAANPPLFLHSMLPPRRLQHMVVFGPSRLELLRHSPQKKPYCEARDASARPSAGCRAAIAAVAAARSAGWNRVAQPRDTHRVSRPSLRAGGAIRLAHIPADRPRGEAADVVVAEKAKATPTRNGASNGAVASASSMRAELSRAGPASCNAL